MNQTILGSVVAIGIEPAKDLYDYTINIRLERRSPKKINLNYELFLSDLTDRKQVFKSIEGSEIFYLPTGYAYNINVWQNLWSSFIMNVSDACIEFNSNLFLFDIGLCKNGLSKHRNYLFRL